MKIAVIGTGLSGYGAIQYLIQNNLEFDIYDVGERENLEIQDLKKRLKNSDTKFWKKEDISLLKSFSNFKNKIIRKKYFGSEYIYKNLSSSSKNNVYIPYSHALGGYSNVWSANAFALDKKILNDWPEESVPNLNDYNEVIKNVEYDEESNDFKNLFPNLKSEKSKKKNSEISEYVFNKLKQINTKNFLSGKIRSLINYNDKIKNSCNYCGFCFTGCAYGSIFNTKDEILNFLNKKNVNFFNSFELISFKEINGKVHLSLKKKGEVHIKVYDKVFIGAGTVNTTKIIAKSLSLYDKELKIKYALSFVIPALFNNKFKFKWPNLNTLPSNAFVFKKDDFKNWIYGHISETNELILNYFKYFKIDSFLKKFLSSFIKKFFTVQIQVGFNEKFYYSFILKKNNSIEIERKTLELKSISKNIEKFVSDRLSKIGFITIPFFTKITSLDDNYYLGSSFPMSKTKNNYNLDLIGRPFGFRNTHIIDSTSFPSIPSVGFGFLCMANSYRITKSSLSSV